jgi:hypothetical protein
MNALNAIVVALALATSPAEYPCETDTCDLLEANSYFDENGVHLLDQILFMEWDERDARYQIRSWRLLKNDAQYPRPCDEGYETTWREGASIRRVTAPKFRVTHTQVDPELIERKHLPREQRHELFQPKPGNDPLPPAPPEER